MIHTQTTMRLSHFHDFYFLQALEHAVSNAIAEKPERGFLKSVESLVYDIAETSEEISANIALRTFVYLYVACLGEARHAAGAEAKDIFLPATLKKTRSMVYEDALNYRPTTENIKVIINVFDQKWGSGFGGKAWKSIAEALLKYYTEPPASFIDHVVDLEHNNGTAFSKGDAKNTIFFDVSYENGRFSNFLDYKFSHNILEKSSGDYLPVTPKVYKLIERYCTMFEKKFPIWIKPNLQKLTEYNVDWGNEKLVAEKKWISGVGVYGGNKPDPHYICSVSSLHRFPYKNVPYFDFLNAVKEKVSGVIKEHFNTPYLKGKAMQSVKEYIEARMYALEPVFKFSYLPVRVEYEKNRNKVYSFVIHLPVKIKGIGKKEGEGCIIKAPHASYYTPPILPEEAVLYKQNGMIILEGKNFKKVINTPVLHLFLKEVS